MALLLNKLKKKKFVKYLLLYHYFSTFSRKNMLVTSDLINLNNDYYSSFLLNLHRKCSVKHGLYEDKKM